MIAPFLDIDRETGAQKKMDRAEQPPESIQASISL
jgi:hypothetical protein